MKQSEAQKEAKRLYNRFYNQFNTLDWFRVGLTDKQKKDVIIEAAIIATKEITDSMFQISKGLLEFYKAVRKEIKLIA